MVAPFLTVGAAAGAAVVATRDFDWVRRSFMLTSKQMKEDTQRWRTYTTAEQKFVDTSLGGNFSINNLPQYTRYADIRRSGIDARNRRNDRKFIGMGAYYSRAIDDKSERITIRAGTPDYNGMLTFFTGFFDSDAALLANEGRTSILSQIFYTAGKVVGTLVTLPLWPWILAGYGFKWAVGNPTSKYYYLKPSMGTYWNRVQFIANTFAVNLGLIPRTYLLGLKPDDGASIDDMTETPTAEYVEYAHKLAPDIFPKSGGVDIYALAGRPQRMANLRYLEMRRIAEGPSSPETLLDEFRKYVYEQKVTDPGSEGLAKYLERYHGSAFGNTENRQKTDVGSRLAGAASAAASPTTLSAGAQAAAGLTPPPDQATPVVGSNAAAPSAEQPTRELTQEEILALAKQAEADGTYRSKWSLKDSLANTLEAIRGWGTGTGLVDHMVTNLQQGSDFVCFKVNHTGTRTESFTNSVGEPEIAAKFNAASQAAKNLRFTLSEGKTGIDLVDGVAGLVTDTLAGIVDGVQMSGLLALAGSAFVDIPQQWMNSSAQMTNMSYRIELRTPYGNTLSRFINLYVPLAMLLALGLPISTGRQSYTAPPILEIYSQGLVTSRLSMLTSMNISRCTGTLGRNDDNAMLGLDIDLTFTELSSIVHAPIDRQWNPLLPWKNVFDEDNTFNDYMSVLSNLSMADQIYTTRKLALNLTNKGAAFQRFFSPAYYANVLTLQGPGRWASVFFRDTERTLAP